MIKVTVQNDALYYDALAQFAQDCKASGTLVELDYPPPAPVQFSGPASTIIVQIDPKTLQAIFEYAAALIVLYKSSSYFGAFFESCLKKLGELTGAKIAESLSILWNKIYKRVHDVNKSGNHTHVDFACHMNLGGTLVEMDNPIFYSHFVEWKDEDVKQAYWLMVLRVIPVLREFASALQERSVPTERLRATVWYSTDWFGHWCWQLEVPLGTFFIGLDGQLITLYDLPFAKKERRASLKIEDIKPIVEAYAQAEGKA